MIRHRRRMSTTVIAVMIAVATVAAGTASAVEIPTSRGAVRRVDTPVLRIPFMAEAPTIDGVMDPGEWEDAAALSSFWYDFTNGNFRYLAPIQTQLQLYAGYDRENLYICFTSPVYPVDSWLRTRGRFPNVLTHPLYGMLWDDHTELELRPMGDLTEGFRHGLLRWDVNPIGTVTDWYWSRQGGHDFRWNSGAVIATVADARRWVIEYAIPLASLRFGEYDAVDDGGRPLVAIPPPDGTAYRTWLARGIGGSGPFFNAFDNHTWNTTKTMLIFDSQAPIFQLNELGPIMDDIIDVQMTVKNHNTRSETVRIGFHVENDEGSIFTSYESPETPGGLLELRPGELRRIRLRQPFPGVSHDGNVLWFDVRSAGRPARTLFRTRLVEFHSMEGGVVGSQSFRERRLDIIEALRPPRMSFDMRINVCHYSKRLSAVIDRGIHGASDESQSAVDARLSVRHTSGGNAVIHSATARFNGNFAVFVEEIEALSNGESYEVDILLFDEHMRIVGDRTEPQPFVDLSNDQHAANRPTSRFVMQPWMNHDIGLVDRVWEPYTPIEADAEGFSTLKHRFALDASGLPAQIEIHPHERNLPLELRGGGDIPPAVLREVGRGPQLRAPLRLEAVVDGETVVAEVIEPAQPVRVWESEIEYVSTLRVGPLDVRLVTRYDCDGSLHAGLTYGSDTPVRVDRLELVADIDGTVDLRLSETGGGGMTGADRWECTLPDTPGVVWDSTMTEMQMYYSRFIPWFWFGSADRGWSYYSTSSEGWILDRDGSTMHLERGEDGAVTWRVAFINHPSEVSGERSLDFAILTHPSKPKPDNYRRYAWHYAIGHEWAHQYMNGGYRYSDAELISRWREAAAAPPDTPDDQRTVWRKDEPPFMRYGWWRNMQLQVPELDRVWEDKATYYFERFIRIGRRVGWWMGEYWPVGFAVSHNLATGNAWLRDPDAVGEDELPWQPTFLTNHLRNHYKRLARVFAKENVPQRQHTTSNNAARMLEPFLWNSLLLEECGAMIRAYEIDLITTFPNSLYRAMGMHYTGLITTLMADASPAKPGDNRRFDRQRTGIALLNDFGVSPNGPHDTYHHKEQGIRLLDRLMDFGYFDAGDLEMLPYWRNDAYVRLGDAPGDETQVRVTVYRRPLDDGNGFKALFVILNESDGDAELPLELRDVARVLGGANTLTVGDVLDRATVPGVLEAAWATADAGARDRPALMDLETGGLIARAAEDAETYGPVFVPYHDYRILYGHFTSETARQN